VPPIARGVPPIAHGVPPIGLRRAATVKGRSTDSVGSIMKLTVGPLPSAVYWRRRAVVLGVGVLVIFMLAYSCTGAAKPSDAANGHAAAPGRSSSAPAAATSAPSLLTPSIGTPPPLDSTPSPAPSLTQPLITGACADAEMSVIPVPATPGVRQGTSLKITLKIKNISNHTCTRDVGANAQELFIQQGATKTWSSDACDALTGNDVRTFEPGIEIEAYVIWNGRVTSQGCVNRPWASPGAYQVFGRLATKLSDPVPLQITP
jgi:hypothetical protein